MVNVEQEQQRLGEVAKRSPQHHFKQLYRHLCDEVWLTEAWRRIKANKGSKTPGVDGITKDDVEETLISHLADRLRRGTYHPNPVKRVYIPKKGGKRRPLGIPTIQDRIVQSALKMLLEPIFEQDFYSCSHGFRPKRSCITALNEVARRYARSTWIIEGDISGCYDNIDHGRLLSFVGKRIRDNRLLHLLRSLLQAGCMDGWTFRQTYSGTPQGGIVTPPTILPNDH